MDSDLPRALSIQKAAVPSAAIALPEIKFATQSLLKAAFRKAVQGDVSGIGDASGFNLPSKSSRRRLGVDDRESVQKSEST